MIIGINYPWIDYGWDFGEVPPAWVASENLPAWREKKRKRIADDFMRFSQHGINAIRWFLLADGLNYGMDASAPQKNESVWTFNPLPAGHSFYSQLLDDFEFVLQVSGRSGLRLFPSLIDFGWCQEGKPVTGNAGIVKGGRYECLIDPEKRKVFFDRILDPLLDVSMRYRDSIYAWELINEPEWVVRGFWHKGVNRTLTRREMKRFLSEGMERINARRLQEGTAAFRSSVGFAHWDSIEKWGSEGLGITLPQFHYYAQKNHELPENPRTDLPCVVGEFATAKGTAWPDLQSLHKAQSITNRLRCIDDKGYSACFLWSANAVDPSTLWTEEAHREVLAYSGPVPGDSIRV